MLHNQPNKVSEAENLCCKLSKELLQSCGSKSTQNLVDISSRIHKKVTKMRENVKSFIADHLERPKETLGSKLPKWVQKIQNLPENVLPSEAEILKILFRGTNEVEQRITRNMKELNKKMSSDYREIMHDIAEECLHLLGLEPCKFSVVGLGSLAREEVTMYSDFEHVIVLEDGVNRNKNYENILEYFRWFSVVFQTIVIGFGETIIPSVQVKSLNGWFFDEITPQGIAFDGMLPRACKIPLGRQPTKKRLHVVELIKTPKDMARYLTYDECVKNGYHLDDVLKRTCLVYGDKKTYYSFVKYCKNNDTGGTEYAKKCVEKIVQNSNAYVRDGSLDTRTDWAFNFKNLLYRPLAATVEFLARIHGIKLTSTIKAIDKLREKCVINERLYHSLSYAFAVVCELRVKLYASVNQQKHETSFDKLYEIVGVEGIVGCQEMIAFLGGPDTINEIIRAIENADMTFIEQFNEFGSSFLELVYKLAHLGYTEKAINLLEKQYPFNDQHHEFGYAYEDILFHSYWKLYRNSEKHQKFCVKEAKTTYKRLLEYEYMPNVRRLEAYFLMGALHYKRNQYLDSMSVFQEYFELGRDLPNQGFLAFSFPQAFYVYHKLAVQSIVPAEVTEHLNTIFRGYKFDNECKIIKRYFALWNELCQLDQLQSKQKYLQDEAKSLTKEIVRHCGKMTNPTLILLDVMKLQICLLCFSDVLDTIELINTMPKKTSCYDQRIQKLHQLDLIQFICLCRLGRYTEALGRTKVNQLRPEYSEKCLLQFLISKVWRRLHSPHYQNDILITILLGITDLKVHKLLDFLFDKAKILFIQFIQPYGEWIKNLASVPSIIQLLACLTRFNWHFPNCRCLQCRKCRITQIGLD